ncbi:MAG: hypothetical protein DMD26_12855 [Gemmatimonadetes bacterium]|nr:MAG: hypothetical protein DMD26_12855 [Gemmatimonadota bacterium]
MANEQVGIDRAGIGPLRKEAFANRFREVRHLLHGIDERTRGAEDHRDGRHRRVPGNRRVLNGREVTIGAAFTREGNGDEPVDTSGEHLGRSLLGWGAATAHDTGGREISHRRGERAALLSHRAVRAVAAARVQAASRLPIQVMRELVCQRSRRRENRHPDGASRRIVKRENRIGQTGGGDGDAKPGHGEPAKDALHIA